MGRISSIAVARTRRASSARLLAWHSHVIRRAADEEEQDLPSPRREIRPCVNSRTMNSNVSETSIRHPFQARVPLRSGPNGGKIPPDHSLRTTGVLWAMLTGKEAGKSRKTCACCRVYILKIPYTAFVDGAQSVVSTMGIDIRQSTRSNSGFFFGGTMSSTRKSLTARPSTVKVPAMMFGCTVTWPAHAT